MTDTVSAYAHRRDLIELILDGVAEGVHLYSRHTPTWEELTGQQPRTQRAAMLKTGAPSTRVALMFSTLAETYKKDDSDAYLWIMLQAERIGLTFWDGEQWQPRASRSIGGTRDDDKPADSFTKPSDPPPAPPKNSSTNEPGNPPWVAATRSDAQIVDLASERSKRST